MEYATDEIIEAKLGSVPDWGGSVDCDQVGFNKKGKLVAFYTN